MLDTGDNQLFDGVEAKRAKPNGLARGARHKGLGERLHEPQHQDELTLSRLPIRVSSERRRSANAGDSGHPCSAAA